MRSVAVVRDGNCAEDRALRTTLHAGQMCGQQGGVATALQPASALEVLLPSTPAENVRAPVLKTKPSEVCTYKR